MEWRTARTAGGCVGLLAGVALACAHPPPPAPAVPAWNVAPRPVVVADDEKALWADADHDLAKLDEEHSLLADEKLDRYLDGVLAGLLPPALPPEMPVPRVRVLRSVERNAGAMADGTVLVSTSFLAALADESQLAALFGHELTHLLARHSLIARRYEAVTASTVQRLELSRAQEDEADRQGVRLMESAGYEPRGALETLSLLAQDDTVARGKNPRFESHPFITERVRTVRHAVSVLEPGRREQERYENAIADALLVAAEGELEAGLLERANAAIDRYLRLRPDSGRGYYWKAEHERRVAKEGRRSPEARRAYERAVELAPDDPDALRALGFLCRETGQPERARELLGHYLSVAPDAADRKLIQRYLGSEAP